MASPTGYALPSMAGISEWGGTVVEPIRVHVIPLTLFVDVVRNTVS